MRVTAPATFKEDRPPLQNCLYLPIAKAWAQEADLPATWLGQFLTLREGERFSS